MKRFVRQKAQDDTDIDLTPMLDVVFIMLIFFIVTATFVREPGVDIVRPFAATASNVANQKLLIAITDKGEVWIDKKAVKKHEVFQSIEALRAQNPQGALVIQADSEANAEDMAFVIDAAKRAGVSDISLAAVQ
ncbi:MAG: biopolymer transporter ExbD [Sinobacterium sp.]|nr:biopolymer transporter ExbD [Sinobacterium sp.]